MSPAGEPWPLTALAGVDLPELTEDEQARLRQSIREHKVLSSVIVSAGPACAGQIADGRARVEICAQLGIPCPEEQRPFASEEEFHLFRLVTNLERRRLSDAQLIRIGLALLPHERERAALRRAQAAGRPRGEKSLPVDLPEQTGEAAAIVAHRVGLKPSTFRRGANVLRYGSPELVAAFDGRRESVNSAHRRLQVERRRATRDAIADELRRCPPPLPHGRYHVLVIDPPWPYESDFLPYPTMPLDAIQALPILTLLSDDAVIWLWTTNAFIERAYPIARNWGLQPKGLLTWAKNRPGRGKPLQGQTEHCLIAIAGAPTFAGSATTLLTADVREDSRKPDQFYDLVERLCPGRKLELFARQRRPGWDAWGAEPDHFPPIPDTSTNEKAPA